MLHTPQQNAVAEQKNRTMVGASKAMLFDQGFSLFLWAKTYKTTVYIHNRCHHTTLGRKIPEEVFIASRLDVRHIYIFNSSCYCHVNADNGKKLEPSGEKGLLFGYRETSKEYDVYILSCKRIIVSRDF